MKIGRKIFYEIATGNIIVDTGERQGAVIATTAEQDIASYTALSERNRDTFDVIELAFGAYAQDFAEYNGYRVNPVSKDVEFLYKELSEHLEDYKQMKIDILKRKCEETIEAGFTSEVNGHVYRTNRDDQINFIGQKDELMNDETILEVFWKTEDAGYLSHVREDWFAIYFEGLAHKRTQLFKYDSLKNQILDPAVDSKEKVDAINW